MTTARDRIVLTGVRAVGYHGVLPEERRDGQEFVVDVVVETDLRPAGESDDLADTVSYAQVANDVVRRVTGDPYSLIEALAGRIAADVLARDRVEAVEVVVHKPQAPVGHEFGDVAVSVRRERRVPVVIALGSNLGDRRATLARAVRDLADMSGFRLDRVSPVVETDPVGGPEQAAYLNAVALGVSSRAPGALLDDLHAIEARHGRVRDVRWGPRTLDLDVVQVGTPGTPDEVRSSDPDLILPHPRAHERAFVLVPWLAADEAASLRVGEGVRRVSDLVEAIDVSGVHTPMDSMTKEWSSAW
jgi:dihydroneopterin aldolase/2-amino-4-hydroxy-6-hydroxymethyldihydropteridine diphosphokinase